MSSNHKRKLKSELLSRRAETSRNGATIDRQENNDFITKAVPPTSVYSYFARLGYREK